MRLMRVGEVGQERPAAMIGAGGDGWAVDISSLVQDISAKLLGPDTLQALLDAIGRTADSLPRVSLAHHRIGPPISNPGKVVCVGLNYRAHAAEAHLDIPAEPILFLRPLTPL